MKQILITVLSYALIIIGYQIFSFHYYEIYSFGPLLKLSWLSVACNLFLTYFCKSGDKTKEVRDILNRWTHYIYFVVLISYCVEYTSKFYGHKHLAQVMNASAKAGVPSLQIYEWRCSGAYYFETTCDLKYNVGYCNSENNYFLEPVDFTDGFFRGRKFTFGGSGKGKGNKLFSGYMIDCSPGHVSYIKKHVKSNSWDGPQPFHMPGQDCDCKKKSNLLE